MRIFVIGPMRPTRDGQGIELATRTSVIKRGVEEIVRQKALSQAHVKAPDDLRGSTIATDVFAQLDAADLVVADLSACSPNVLYELAFVDSLGLPTVLVCDDDTDIPFYFRGLRVQKLPAITPETVAHALEDLIVAMATGSGEHDLFSNPLRDFYRAAVVDISAAAGLAIGYYDNFVRPIVMNGGVLDLNRARVEGMIVVTSTDLSNFKEDQDRLYARAAAVAGLSLVPDQALSRGAGMRSFTVTLLGRAILDLPSAVYSLEQSPRLRQMKTRLERQSGREAAIRSMRTSLLNAFVRAFNDRRDDDTGTHKDQVVMATPDTIESVVETARAAGWLA